MISRAGRSVTLGATAAAAGVALLAVSGWLLSRAAEHPPVLYLMVAIVAVRACGLARGLLRYLERLLTHDLALRRQQTLRVEVFRALASTTWVGRRSGDLLSRVVGDVALLTDGFVRAVVPLCSAGIVVLGAGVVLVVLEPSAGLAVVAASVVGTVLVPLTVGRLTAADDRELARLRSLLAVAVTEAGRAAPDLLAYGAGPRLLAQADRADGALRAAERRSAFASGLAGSLQLVTTGAGTVLALTLGAAAVSDGHLPAVDLAVLVFTPIALHDLVLGVPPALQALARSRAAAKRISLVLTTPPFGHGDVAVDGPARPGRVRLRALTLAWPDRPPAVTGLDLCVRPGERVALVGPTGAGKSTVAAAVMGLLPPRAGRLEVDGRVGLLAQDAHLFDTTVAANLRLGRPDADEAEVAAALGRVRLTLHPDRFVGENGDRVSGGEARRLALARLRLESYDLVVLDEPTEHLDRTTADALMDDLFDLTAGKALLVVTHDQSLADRCDRIVRLDGAPGTATPFVDAAPALLPC